MTMWHTSSDSRLRSVGSMSCGRCPLSRRTSRRASRSGGPAGIIACPLDSSPTSLKRFDRRERRAMTAARTAVLSLAAFFTRQGAILRVDRRNEAIRFAHGHRRYWPRFTMPLEGPRTRSWRGWFHGGPDRRGSLSGRSLWSTFQRALPGLVTIPLALAGEGRWPQGPGNAQRRIGGRREVWVNEGAIVDFAKSLYGVAKAPNKWCSMASGI